MSAMTDVAMRTLRGERVRGVARRMANMLPEDARRRIKNTTTRVETAMGHPPLLVPPGELEAVYREALDGLVARGGPEAVGDYLEFGVFVGTSLACMARALDAAGLDAPRLIGFDSFEGLPEAARADDEGAWLRPGRWASGIDNTRRNLVRQGVDMSRVTLVKGWFDDTCTPELARRLNIRRAGVVMLDCDLSSSTTTALDFVEPFLRGEAVLVFDDWGDLAHRDLGQKRSLDEFLDRHPRFETEAVGDYGDTGHVVRLIERSPD